MKSLLPFKLDLDAVVKGVGESWYQLKGQTLLITGGTGIIGKWLLASVLHADAQLSLGLRIQVLSRNPQHFRLAYPEFGDDPRVRWITGDVRSFTLPEGEHCSHVIHAATDVVAAQSPGDVLDTCVSGTLNILEVARRSKTRRMLLISSGAVYGKAPQGLGAIPESFSGPLDWLSPDAAYSQGKRCSELLCESENSRGQMVIPIARCFAMVGPYLPLDKHFAIGNFIRSALTQDPIVIEGDGTPVRSYLYLSDVATQLFLLLFLGRGGIAYNVGGSEAVTISELAKRVISVLSAQVEIRIKNKPLHGAHADIYYPETSRIRQELNLELGVSLDAAIEKTAQWYRN